MKFSLATALTLTAIITGALAAPAPMPSGGASASASANGGETNTGRPEITTAMNALFDIYSEVAGKSTTEITKFLKQNPQTFNRIQTILSPLSEEDQKLVATTRLWEATCERKKQVNKSFTEKVCDKASGLKDGISSFFRAVKETAQEASGGPDRSGFRGPDNITGLGVEEGKPEKATHSGGSAKFGSGGGSKTVGGGGGGDKTIGTGGGAKFGNDDEGQSGSGSGSGSGSSGNIED